MTLLAIAIGFVITIVILIGIGTLIYGWNGLLEKINNIFNSNAGLNPSNNEPVVIPEPSEDEPVVIPEPPQRKDQWSVSFWVRVKNPNGLCDNVNQTEKRCCKYMGCRNTCTKEHIIFSKGENKIIYDDNRDSLCFGHCYYFTDGINTSFCPNLYYVNKNKWMFFAWVKDGNKQYIYENGTKLAISNKQTNIDNSSFESMKFHSFDGLFKFRNINKENKVISEKDILDRYNLEKYMFR